jgi:uncharacterized protein (TIGR02646 family)
MVKVDRTFPAPKSLERESKKKTGSYSEPDVVEQLKKDFHNKCYICEINELQDPQVEHLLPHENGKYPERKFDWNNLFWPCGHCNNVKNQRKYDEGIIDCCKEDPEELIYFGLLNEEVQIYARDKENEKAILTAQLVTEVFNLKNTGMRIYKSEQRFQELNREMNKLYDALEEMNDNPESNFVLRKLKALLRRETKFAAFKRNYIRENQDRFPQLLRYIA